MNAQEALKMAQEVLNLYCEQLNSKFANDALKAIDEALAQPQPKLFLDLSNSNGNHPVQQEPVGYLYINEDKTFGARIDKLAKDLPQGTHKIYTHPAPAWQGLTAKEIASIPLNEYTVQTVERMLKEKNT